MLMNANRLYLFGIIVALAATAQAQTNRLTVAEGPFKPEWESLATQYQCPDWFRDAKFGIWAHWGPQCQPEYGDWYARKMYIEGDADYKYHVEHYGHPSKFGFKDVIHEWKAEKFDPEKLIALYKRAGAQYFVALANHHDNFDNFNSKFQPWNSVAIGPKKDLVGMWEKAARAAGLRFGVTVHAAHAWSWYEPAQGADTNGPMKGVSYDGKLTKADGKGQWWDGLDPQDLYAQNHAPGQKMVWEWDLKRGSSVPDAAYGEKFYKRTQQLIDDYKPDLLYFDDSVLPLGYDPQIGLGLAAHFYHSSIRWHGKNEAVMTTKRLTEQQQRKALTWDIERGRAEGIEPFVWQTDTCIGGWHYDGRIFERHRYKTAAAVIPMLADIVSKNGNLLLNIPVRGDGTIDADEVKVVEDIAAWMSVNSECIFGTRPWKVYGEGPSTALRERGQFGGMRDTQSKPFTAEDMRFTTKGDTLYAILLAWPPDGKITIKSLAGDGPKPKEVTLLGHQGNLEWSQTATGLEVTLPAQKPCEHAFAVKIKGVPTR
jgi:alpha-L-fucosidase